MTEHGEEDHKARERAQELQMEALLTELGGIGPDRSLASRILEAAAVRNDQRNSDAASDSTTPPKWLIAAFVLVGLSVVGGIAWMRGGQDKAQVVAPPEPQDPKPDKQDVPAKQDPKPAPKPRELTTVLADYSDNRVIEVDSKGREIFVLEEVFGAWDADILPNGNFLIVEFSVSRVIEMTRKGEEVWRYENLKNPYCAQRLKNGNTLIADTFGGRVIEVDKKGKVVWKFSNNIRPFDAEMTAKGTVLIADVLGGRVIEINRKGEIVWVAKGLPNAHDADRLANGNTLVTLRNKGEVVELDGNGKVVWSVKGLTSPSDADRLPNGNTLISENTRCAEYDKAGKRVWVKEMTWCVEANRGPR